MAKKVSIFKNEEYSDFSRENVRRKMEEALKKVKSELGKEYPLIIGGEKIKTAEKFASINPSQKDQVIGYFSKADEAIARKAIETAAQTFETWKFVDPAKRADYLFKAAKVMKKRRFELNAWMVLEVGKTWLEADGDTAEAIDFLEFYAREMLRYSGKQPVTPYKGEKNELVYIPLGVGVVIPPWNFPLAILCGMTSAALVTGNTVVLKPSSDSPAIGYQFMRILEEAGLPKGVVNFVSGPGSIAGNTMVGHPKTRFISFTGSKEVGLKIVELAAKTQPGQIWIKRVVAEMGGKDAIVVDEGVNIDEAVAGVSAAAYGFQGQKCSACSKVIVHEKIYDEFLRKLEQKVKSLKVGPSEYYSSNVGPVVNEKSYNSIMNYIEIGKKEGRLIAGGRPAGGNGYYIEPTVIADIDTKAKISQEEIFGPVLAVIKAKSCEDGIRIANDTEFGLTGAVYTKSRKKLDLAKKLFHVGNLYLNRKCTGALVGVHPFGGFNMSGTDSKAGGRDYLLLFMQGKSIAEKK